VKYLIFILTAFVMFPAAGQITAPGSTAQRTTVYPGGYSPNDPVFIFCSDGSTRGTLHATSPGGTGPFTFEWRRWSTTDNGFTIPVIIEANATTSTVANLEEGGYRVRITDGGGYEANLIAWVHLARPTADATLLDRRCDWVALKGVAAADQFDYYHPVSGAAVRLPASRTFLWSSDPVSVIPFPSLEVSPVTYTPPLDNVTYKLVVTDNFGCVNESSFYYESIHVKADFSIEPDQGEAPLEVTFTDKSVRGHYYTWKFGDDSVSYAKDPGSHIYYKPGSYTVTLVIESDLTCVDSMSLSYVTVDPSSLNIPNVFTPDGDGSNDFFRPDITSLRFIDVQVFTRSGAVVYTFRGEGDRLKDWIGWDGSVNGSSVKASPGLYFYVIRAIGWDDVGYRTKENRGFLYLYR
jgi:gliding motility-associated-like protein